VQKKIIPDMAEGFATALINAEEKCLKFRSKEPEITIYSAHLSWPLGIMKVFRSCQAQ